MMNCHFHNENLIDKEEVKKFLSTHRDIELSAAKLIYSLHIYSGAQEVIADYCNNNIKKTDEDLKIEKTIAEATEPNELLMLMRKSISQLNQRILRNKLMKYEEKMLLLIQEKCLHNKNSMFIENALHFFLYSKENCCDWIIENYSEFHSEYLKSMFCLVLGFRGDVDMIPFLMEEAKRLEREYPMESYDQGPVLAIQELTVRFFN